MLNILTILTFEQNTFANIIENNKNNLKEGSFILNINKLKYKDNNTYIGQHVNNTSDLYVYVNLEVYLSNNTLEIVLLDINNENDCQDIYITGSLRLYGSQSQYDALKIGFSNIKCAIFSDLQIYLEDQPVQTRQTHQKPEVLHKLVESGILSYENGLLVQKEAKSAINSKQAVGNPCLPTQMNLNDACVSDCSSGYPYIYNSYCHDACQNTDYKIIVGSPTEIYCISACPPGFVAVIQSTYGSYQQCVQTQQLRNLNDECDWMKMSRIISPTKLCSFAQPLDFSNYLLYSTNTPGSALKMDVVNVQNLSVNEHIAAFIAVNSTVTNGLLIFDVTIDFNQFPALPYFKVSIFDSVQEPVTNVIVSGVIRLTNVNTDITRNITLSRMFGNVYMTPGIRTTVFTNVSSDIRYMINGIEITADNFTAGFSAGTIIRLVNSFEEALSDTELGGADPSSYAIPVGPVAKPLGMKVMTGELYQQSVRYQNDSGLLVTMDIYVGFDPIVNQNAFNDFYKTAYMQYLDKIKLIKGLQRYPIDRYGIITDIFDSGTRMAVYAAETRAVMLTDNMFIVTCRNGVLLDIESRQCIQRSSCQSSDRRFIFKAMCLKQCPNQYKYTAPGNEFICHQDCPLFLGFINPPTIDLNNPLNNMCVQCSGATNKASPGVCVSQCILGYYSFNLGCYESCPFGTNTQGLTCVAPSSLSDCSTGYFVDINSYSPDQFYNQCWTTTPYGFYQLENTNGFSWQCSSKVLLNDVCTANSIQCSDQPDQNIFPVVELVGITLFCSHSCFDGKVNSSAMCQNQCQPLNYKQQVTGSCLQCQSQNYDGGVYIRRDTNVCVPTCSFINQSLPTKICESAFDTINCPMIVNQLDLMTCINTSCVNDLFENYFNEPKICSNNSCLSTNGKYIFNVGKVCNPCSDNYYIDNNMIQCSNINCSETDGYYYQFNITHKVCVTQAQCFTAGDYYVNFALKQCSMDECMFVQKYWYRDTTTNHKICKDCSQLDINYYVNLPTRQCSNDACVSETIAGSAYYEMQGVAKICTNCLNKWFETEVITGAICSNDNCQITSNGVYHLDASMNRICDLCPAKMYTDSNLHECQVNPDITCNLRTQCRHSYSDPLDLESKKFCYICNLPSDYLTGCICRTTPCTFFKTVFTVLGVTINECSSSSCSIESNSIHYIDANRKICTNCTGTDISGLVYLTSTICSQTECEYYQNALTVAATTKLCSSTACTAESSGVFYTDSISSKKICGNCPEYLYGTTCSPVPCPVFADLANKICSTTDCSETNGKYFMDGTTKMCTNCDGTVGGAGMTYLTGLLCSNTPCTFFNNLALKICSVSCAETNGVYNIELSNKVCGTCASQLFVDQTLTECTGGLGCESISAGVYKQIDALRKHCTTCNNSNEYLHGLQCTDIKCTYFTNFFLAGSQRNECSQDSCITQTAGIYQYRYGNAGDDLLCTGCIWVGGFKYLTNLFCSNIPCAYYQSIAQLSSGGQTLCSSTQCLAESNSMIIINDSKSVCDTCAGLTWSTYVYKYGNECRATPCEYYSDFSNKRCSLQSCSGSGETSGIYFTDASSNKICTNCDGTVGGSQMLYKTGLICGETPCSYYLSFPLRICSVGTCSETGNSFFTDASNNKICSSCEAGKKIYNGGCYSTCPVAAPFLQINQIICDTSCVGQTIYQIGDQKNCLTSCDPSNFLGQGEAGYQICINCTSDKIAQRSDNQCILRTHCVYFNSDPPVCESGIGLNCPKILVRDANSYFCRQNCTGYLEYQNQCYSKCPVNTIMDVSGTTCLTTCSFYRLVTFSSILQPQCQTDTCTDFQYIDPQYHSLISGCFSVCPAGTLKTRTNTCVKDCVIFDVYPSPTYCEIPGTPSCLNFRKVSGKSVFICAACTSQEFLNGFECALNCDGQFVQLSNKSICQSTCGSFPKGYTEETFNSVSVNVCQDTCPPEFPYYDSVTLLGTQRCFVSNCGAKGKYLETNQKCVPTCASGNYFINISSTNRFQCQDTNQSCDRYYKNDGMNECYAACPLIYPFLNGSECLKSCDPYMNDPKSPTQKLCLSSCGGVNPPYTLNDADGRTQCTSSCGDLFVQQVGKKFSCVSFCQFYTWDGGSKICTSTCEYYRIDPVKDSKAKWCADSCAALNMTYSIVDGSGKNQCVSSCPAAYPFLDGAICKDYCQFIVEQQITDVSKFKCQAAPCPKFYQLYPPDNSIRICRQNCVGSAPYVFGSQCVSNCGLTTNKYVGPDGLTCVSTCSGETAMNETAAVWFCDSSCDFYSDSGAKTCSSAGTVSYPYRKVYQQIVTNGVTTTRYQYVSSCPNNEYAVVGGISVCQTCTLYELVGAAHKCVASCSASQVQFKYQCFTGLCKDILGVGSSFYSGVDKKCSQTCGDNFVYDQVSFQCSSTCPANSVYFVSGGQQICSSLCAGTNDYVTLDSRYAINGVGQCVQICPVGSFKELLQAGDTYKYCVSQCVGKQYKVVAGEQTCVSTCPVHAMEAGGVKRCYDSCGDSAQNKIQVFISGSETQCVSLCPPSHPFMAANGDLECIQTCPNLFYSLVGNVRKCLDSCSLNTSVEVSFSVPSHQLCTGACDAQQMFLRDSGVVGTCVEVCPLTKNYYDTNRECQSECIPKVYRIDGAQKQCMASCSNPYTRIVIDNDYQQCNLVCSGLTPYMKLDNICVALCPVGTYQHDKICQLSCPSTMKYALFQSGHHICSTTCPSLVFSSQSGAQSLFCQDSCLSPNLYRNDVSSGYIQCLTQCGAGEYQHSTRECNIQNCLQDPVNKFVSNWVCLLTCPDFVDLSDYSCKATCSGSFSGYVQQVVMSQNSRVCHPTCPTNFIDLRASSQYKSAGVCVTYCPTTETLYQEAFSATKFYCTQKCSDANRFVQQDLVYCGNTCASTFFQQNETSHNFCISSCDMPFGRLSTYGITQCMVCPKYVSEVDQACLATCDFSNVSLGAQICRMSGGARNPATCPVYTNNAAPFLCILACFTMRDGPWCVQDCSVTGKRFVPESGFDCVSSCPYFYEFQQIFGVEQPRCNTTCDFMLSSANLQECQRKCYSNTSVYVFGLTYCSNCSSTQKLLVQANKLFSCISTACPDSTQPYINVCSYIECGQTQVQSASQTLAGYICSDPFSFNYTTSSLSVTNKVLTVAQIQVSDSLAYILLQNGSVLSVNESGYSEVLVNNVVSLSPIALPPFFDELKMEILFQNGTYYQERTDFTNETVKQIIGFFDPHDTDMSINYLLTDQNLYFRGSCKAGLCTKDVDGNDFDTTFNGKTKFRSMWTKMNLAAAGFPFVASQVKDIQDLDWTILFTLSDGRKFVYGLNRHNRLCSSVVNVVLTEVSAYDIIYVGDKTTLLSKGADLFVCGASFGVDDIDVNSLYSTPTSISVAHDEEMGWSFVNQTIVDISGSNGGFVIRTPTEVFGLGRCTTFSCLNFKNQYVLYSGHVQKLKWLTKSIRVLGNTQLMVQYYSQATQPVYINDTKLIEEDMSLNQNGTLDFMKSSAATTTKKWPLILGVFLAADVIACASISALVNKMKKYHAKRNALVQVYIKREIEFQTIEPVNNENVERNLEITHNINALNVFEFE
ncbi:VSP [Hexamita inflata]|uniref:VSP n=1 Tax=Hexamita inflata TaxID=28002 RepID=A0AA86NI87_9EUKA|nr:VSP [Hexamita inflata]